jgi:katanin p60 ATPase-containing subunit A1
LYGPPGTGKTMLAKAAAGVSDITFFNSSAATMVNKYRGESEKLTRCLFRMARHYSPAIIFIDEIDALARQRGAGQEHEADRRLKSLLFSEMDGIHSGGDENNNTPPRVVVLATTNVPWDLDEAMRRRLEKRIYVPLPDHNGRAELLRLCLANVETTLNDSARANVVKKTAGFSCADVKLLCREAAMMPMRKMLGTASPMEILNLRKEGKLGAPPPVSHEDFVEALTRTKSSVQKEGQMERYEHWAAQFGST